MLSLDESASLVRKGHDDWASVEAARAKVMANAIEILGPVLKDLAGHPSAIEKSVAQFVGYVVGHGVDRDEAVAAANDVVAKLESKKPQPKSKFPNRPPSFLQNETNTRRVTGAKVPQQQKTKPRAAGDPEPEDDSDPYADPDVMDKALALCKQWQNLPLELAVKKVMTDAA